MNEDFVPFDLAMKLKEKGFDEECFAHYDDLGNLLLDKDYWKLDSHILAPTISQVLKWLRKKKDIFIELEYINQEAYGCTIIIQKTGGLIAKWDWDKFKYASKNPLVGNTCEEASNLSIKYVVGNLI